MPADRPVPEPAAAATHDLTRRQAVAALTAGFALAVRERWSALFLIREGPSLTARPTPEFSRLAR